MRGTDDDQSFDLEFSRRCFHVARVLRGSDVAHPELVAPAWVAAVADEADPTFSIREWVEAGWRDPVLVGAVVRILSSRAAAEDALNQCGYALNASYSSELMWKLMRCALGYTAALGARGG
jgi:hypothetical protein